MSSPTPTDLAGDAHDPKLQRGEAVFRALRHAIQEGLYRPGDRLREEEVALRLNVSRTPVREALGRLTSKGMLVPATGRGLVVRSLDATEVLELYSMREILEGAAARLAARHASPIEIEGLMELVLHFGRASTADAMAKSNRLFHEAVMRSARNRFLESALGEFQDSVALLGPTTFTVEDRPVSAVREHSDIVNAMAARDADAAEKAARHHIREALRARLRMRMST